MIQVLCLWPPKCEAYKHTSLYGDYPWNTQPLRISDAPYARKLSNAPSPPSLGRDRQAWFMKNSVLSRRSNKHGDGYFQLQLSNHLVAPTPLMQRTRLQRANPNWRISLILGTRAQGLLESIWALVDVHGYMDVTIDYDPLSCLKNKSNPSTSMLSSKTCFARR
jgi:hypothetical protein